MNDLPTEEECGKLWANHLWTRATEEQRKLTFTQAIREIGHAILFEGSPVQQGAEARWSELQKQVKENV